MSSRRTFLRQMLSAPAGLALTTGAGAALARLRWRLERENPTVHRPTRPNIVFHGTYQRFLAIGPAPAVHAPGPATHSCANLQPGFSNLCLRAPAAWVSSQSTMSTSSRCEERPCGATRRDACGA